MAELLVQIDGENIPLARCRWVRFNGDGCAEGSMYPDRGDEVIGTPEQAHRQFTPRQRDRDRDDRRGYTHELLTREQWDRRALACLLGECEHRTEVAQ